MKVLGLVSGGKDSIYNLILCEQYGHEIVALGNLLPREGNIDELDSYMYQTVGHQLVDSYASCAQVPLFRRQITGSSLHKELDYVATEADEVEDLLSLIAYAKSQLPCITAVSSGAIASDYQRLRVEHPQAGLLQGMIDSNITAILIKVAALGLEPHKHLCKTLQKMQSTLHDLNRRYGCNICGEGGEYETMVLDCPLFPAAHVVLDDWDIILHSKDSVASVGIVHPKSFHTEPKASEGTYPLNFRNIMAPIEPASPNASQRQSCHYMDSSSQRAVDSMHGEHEASLENSELSPSPESFPIIYVPSDFAIESSCQEHRPADRLLPQSAVVHFHRGSGFWSVWCRPHLSTHGSILHDVKVAVHSALTSIADGLKQRGMAWRNVLQVQVWLRDMAHFLAVNEVYVQHFPGQRPAARACVQALLPEEEPAMIQLIASDRESDPERVLHVQSISKWAPSCIGPYSQAVEAQGLIFFAGQIGLDPPTMQLLPSLTSQIQQCIASCQAVAVAMGVSLGSNILAATLYSTPEAGSEAQKLLHEALTGILQTSAVSDAEEGMHIRDAYLSVSPQLITWQPLLTFLELPGLPKGALVEIQPLACTARDTDGTTSSSSSDSLAESPKQSFSWIRRLQNQVLKDGTFTVTSLYSQGKFCKCIASGNCKDFEQQSHDREAVAACIFKERKSIHVVVRDLLHSASRALSQAGLSPADVVVLHLFYRASLTGNPLREEDFRADNVSLGAFEHVPFAFVPVLSMCVLPGQQCDVMLEMLSWKF